MKISLWIILKTLPIALFIPVLASAFSAGTIPNAAPGLSLNDIIDVIFSVAWPFVVAVLVIAFLFIGFLFFTAQGNAEKIAQARTALLGAVVVTVIALLAFSLPFIIRNTVGQGI